MVNEYDILLAIWHALDERDWERLRYFEKENYYKELIEYSKKLPEMFHPFINPEYSANKLIECIKKKDRECAFNQINQLLFVTCMKKDLSE